jgi:hypothetical protein
MADTVEESLEENAVSGVQSVTVDGMTTTAMDPLKQAKIADRDAQKSAMTKNHCGRLLRTLKPGACG